MKSSLAFSLSLGLLASLALAAQALADSSVPVVAPPSAPIAPRPAAPVGPRWASMSCMDIMNQIWAAGWQGELLDEAFPYSMERRYQKHGVKLKESELNDLPVRIEVDLNFEMCSKDNWPVFLKTMGLPADTPSPVDGAPIDQAKLNPADGNKKTWIAVDLFILSEQEVKNPTGHTPAAVLLIGDRQYFKDVGALMANQVSDAATAKVIVDLFSGPSASSETSSAPIVPVTPVGPVLPTSDKH